MDTKPLELETEFLVQHELIKCGFKVAKPSFDTHGADLLIVNSLDKKHSKFLVVQCKGRTVKTSSNIKISKTYITENFVLFAYLKFEKNSPELYIFMPDDIKQWKEFDGEYCLNLTNSPIFRNSLQVFIYSPDSVHLLRNRLLATEIKKYSSLIVDEAFIHKAIDKTLDVYARVYPKRVFERPSVNEVIKSILSVYDNFQSSETPVNCHVFMDENNESFNHRTFSKLQADDDVDVKVYREFTNGNVVKEILDYLERIINVENVMIVVDDFAYEKPLNSLKSKGVDIRIIQFSSHNGREAYTDHKWGDIIYAVAHAMGLSRFEW